MKLSCRCEGRGSLSQENPAHLCCIGPEGFSCHSVGRGEKGPEKAKMAPRSLSWSILGWLGATGPWPRAKA